MTTTPAAIRQALADHERYSFMYSEEYRRGGEEMANLIAFRMMLETGDKEWKELHEEFETKSEQEPSI